MAGGQDAAPSPQEQFNKAADFMEKGQFAEAVPIQATPTTLVLDKQGRVAARIIGPIDSPSILSTLVKDALAETS